jgi:hypothetical protein
MHYISPRRSTKTIQAPVPMFISAHQIQSRSYQQRRLCCMPHIIPHISDLMLGQCHTRHLGTCVIKLQYSWLVGHNTDWAVAPSILVMLNFLESKRNAYLLFTDKSTFLVASITRNKLCHSWPNPSNNILWLDGPPWKDMYMYIPKKNEESGIKVLISFNVQVKTNFLFWWCLVDTIA